MASNQDLLVREMSHLQVSSNYSPQQYATTSKKIAPIVPPKPKSDMYATVGPKSNGMYHSPVHPSSPHSTMNQAASSGDPIYSNYHPDDDLPPPPPPPPPQVASYSPAPQQYPPPPPPDAGPAPSSPGSSTYGTQAYSSYRPNSSVSSYDASSIYEPITPRPPSQMSNRSNYSIGSGGSSLYSSYYPASGRGKGPVGRKEAEVDRLTDLMVQSMENSSDPEFYEDEEEEEIPVIGMCYKCGEKVFGEGSGCTAMDHVYHISCFTCHVCHKELRGKPFYARDGRPFCEDDYLNTLEKCCVCGGRILERILRATGKPYHPNCFTCVVCGKGLDGIPFTVDATSQIYCIDDFHKKFAPRCCVCKQPIMPEHGKEETVRVVALDRSFHVDCYRCEDCGLKLSSEAEGSCYPLDDHILCRSCNAKRVQALTSCMTTEL